MANSLTELNNFSNIRLPYQDQRPWAIEFSANAAPTQYVAITEDAAVVAPAAIDIVRTQSFQETGINGGNVIFTIDASSVAGNIVFEWPAPAPSGVTYSTPAPKVYRAQGTISPIFWNNIKNPSIIAKDVANNFSFTSNITYPSVANIQVANSWSWTTQVTVTAGGELTTPAGFVYDEDTAKLIPGPQIIDGYTGNAAYNITVTPNVANAVLTWSSTGNATGNINPVTKSYTLTGTKSDVNQNLTTIIMTPGVNYDKKFDLNWSLTNPISNLVTQVNQQANIGNIDVDWTNSNIARNYVINGTSLMFTANVPAIVEEIPGATYTANLILGSNVGIITNGSNLVSPPDYNVSTRTWSTSGTKSQVNAAIANVYYVPYRSSVANTTVTLTSTRSGSGLSFSDNFALNCANTQATPFGTAGNAILYYTEDQVLPYATQQNFAQVTKLPHWSDPIGLEITTQQANITVPGLANFTTLDGWTQIANAAPGNSTGVYKNISSATSVATQLARLSAYGNLSVFPNSDVDADYNIIQKIANAVHNGNTFGTGNVNTFVTSVDGTGSPEYQVYGPWTQVEDTPQGVGARIVDTDQFNTEYRVRYVQTVPTPTDPTNTGVFYYYNPATSAPFASDRTGDSGWITGNTVQLNSSTNDYPLPPYPYELNKVYYPGIDYTGNVTILFSQEKLVGNTWVSQAANVAQTITYTPTVEWLTPLGTSFTYTESTALNLYDKITLNDTAQAFDPYGNAIVYTQTWTQTTPDPTQYVPRWSTNGNGYESTSSPLVLSGSKITINSKVLRYFPPTNYAGPIVLTAAQTRTQEGNVYAQGSQGFNFNIGATNTSASLTIGSSVGILDVLTLANCSVSAIDPFTEKAFRFDIEITGSTGNATANIWLDGVNVGQSGNLVANVSALNTALDNSYIDSITAGSITVQRSITQTEPNADRTIATTSSSITLTNPVKGQLTGGGYYLGTFDVTGGSTPTHHLIVSVNPVSAYWYSNGTPAPAVNSLSDGYTNTSALNSLSFPHAYNAWNLTESGYSDWYLPSREEAYFAAVEASTATGGLRNMFDSLIGGFSGTGTLISSSRYDISGTQYVGEVLASDPPGSDPLVISKTNAVYSTLNTPRISWYMRRVPI